MGETEKGTRCADPRTSKLHEKSGPILLYINTPDGPGFVVKLCGVGRGHKLHGVSRWTVLAPNTKHLKLKKKAKSFTAFLGGASLAARKTVTNKKTYFAKLWFSYAPHSRGEGGGRVKRGPKMARSGAASSP